MIEAVATAPEPAARRFTAWPAFYILVAYFAAQLLAAIVVTLVASGYYPPARLEQVAILPSVILGFALGAWVMVRMIRRSFAGRSRGEVFQSLGVSRGSWRAVAAGVGLGLALALAYVMVLIPHYPAPPDQPWGPLVTAASAPGWQRHLWALTALLLAPPIEELLFRGVLFEGFANSWGQARAAIAVTAIFTAFHLPEIRAYWPAIVGVAVVATITMVLRLVTRSIGPTIALHAAYNFGLVFSVYVGNG